MKISTEFVEKQFEQHKKGCTIFAYSHALLISIHMLVRVSVKRGVKAGVGAGVGVGVSFFLSFFLSFNPNSDFSQFASAVYRYNIFRCNENE